MLMSSVVIYFFFCPNTSIFLTLARIDIYYSVYCYFITNKIINVP